MDDRGHAAVAHLLAAQGKDSTAGLLARHAARPRVARGAGADRFGGVTLDTLQYLLGGLSGGIVGFTLGLVGGGGSILAVPLMVYLVGVASPHVAIGASALAVAANAASGPAQHARAGTVNWRWGVLYEGGDGK